MLGLIGWEVTVISSNFLALMLIITISMNIHLAVRYRQLLQDEPGAEQLELVSMTLQRMVRPCLYTALTTIIGFSSLVLSDIKPVQDFGWMMSAGLAVAFLTSFSLFPAILVLLGKRSERPSRTGLPLTAELAALTERHGSAILVAAAILAVVGGFGISRLTVENSFIDYFRSDTEIYEGMKLIDDELGGTTPLQVLLNLDPDRGLPDVATRAEEDDLADDEDDFEDWDIDVASGPAYWFTPFKIDRVKEVHDYLDGLPEVGKVLSLASVIRIAEDLNDGKELEGLELSVLYQKMPSEIREPLIDPYFSFEHNEARILLRILDSKPGLRRKELLDRIRADLADRFQLTERDVTLTGALVLYNNMLQSLYASQISSLGAVMVGITLTLLLLFRSLRLAVIGIVPSLLAAVVVLGLMGLVGIPLDMMTITIAAITIGIAVDNGIHYIYRFREEFPASGDYVETLRICHSNIGRAVLYTSTTIIVGFSILVLSNFLPTVYFGVLTGLAMLIALLAALTLLPRLILVWRPFG
jgi:predicted RND superfamily exporter protein